MAGKKTSPDSKSKRLYFEDVCTRFENEWRRERTNQLEELLETVEKSMRADVATELIAVELELRSEIGENPECEEYLKRLPDYSSGVRRGFELWTSERGVSVYGDKNFPERIGDYRIVDKLGEGGMGVVYEAVQESLDRRVAIKSLGTHPVHAPRSARRFRREARAVAMLHHTNIINVYGSGVHDGIPYFAMQLVDGNSIRQIIDQTREQKELSNHVDDRGLLSYLEVARIGVQVASALEYAHQQGVLHRDIKPSNLLLDENSTAWVSDFGLAKVKNNADATFSGDVVGTLRYVPPEAAKGKWTELGDVYSLGITLYEMLTLEPAYPETNRVELMNRITQGDNPIALRRYDSKIPRDLETIVNKAMSRDQSSRYQSAAELGRELRRFVDGEPITARPTSSTERLIKWSRRRPLIAALSAMILALFAFGFPLLTWLWLRTEFALNSVEAERMRTVGAKLEAEVARKVSEIARLDAEASEYGSTMQLAHSYLQDDNVTETRRLLAKWNPASKSSRHKSRIGLIGWEWNYLNQQLDQSLMTLRGDMDYVWHVAISPDDSMIATVHASESQQDGASSASEIIIWDAHTGRTKIKLPEIYFQIYSSAFSPDGSKLAVLGVEFDDHNDRRGGIQIWDLATSSLTNSVDLYGRLDDLKELMFEEDVRPAIQYSPDGKRLMVEPVEIFDVNSLERLQSYDALQGEFINSEQILLYGENKVQILNENESDDSRICSDANSKVHFGANVVAGNLSLCFRDHIRIFSTDALQETEKIEFCELNWGCLSKDGETVVAGDRDGRIHVGSLGACEVERTLIGHESTITHGAMSHRGDWLVTCSVDGTAKIWDLAIKTDRAVFDSKMTHSVIGDLCFSSGDSGDKIQFAGRQRKNSQLNCGTINLQSGESGFHKIKSTYKANWPRTDMSFSADGNYFCAPMELGGGGDAESTGFDQSGRIGIWECRQWQLVNSHEVGLDEITSIAWHPSGKRLAIAGRKGACCSNVFDVDSAMKNLRLVQQIEFDCDIVTAMCFRGDDFAMAAENRVAIYDLGAPTSADNQLEPRQMFADAGAIHSIDFSPDGKLIAVAVKDLAKFRVYELESGKRRFEYPAPRNVCCVRYSPDGKRLALSGYDSLVYLCDAKSGHRCLSLVGSEISPGSFSINSKVVFSPDGQRIATNNWKGEIRVWNAAGRSDDASDIGKGN